MVSPFALRYPQLSAYFVAQNLIQYEGVAGGVTYREVNENAANAENSRTTAADVFMYRLLCCCMVRKIKNERLGQAAH